MYHTFLKSVPNNPNTKHQQAPLPSTFPCFIIIFILDWVHITPHHQTLTNHEMGKNFSCPFRFTSMIKWKKHDFIHMLKKIEHTTFILGIQS